jgi:hypothetical protein
MRKRIGILSAIAWICLANATQAQLINPGFETWTTDLAVPTAMNPNSGSGTTGWWDYNVYNYAALGSSPISVHRSDTAHAGLYSARIQTVVYTPTSWNIYKAFGVPYIGHNYSDTLGILFNGNVNETNQTYKPGIPCTQKIASFSFYYQYAPKGVDTAECRVSLVKQRALVAGGSFKTTLVTGSTWYKATINMTYIDTLTPDSLYVLFSSSSLDSKAKPGSVLWIDDASIPLLSGIVDRQIANDLVISPNPSNGVFKVHLGKDQLPLGNYQVAVFNTLGEKMASFQVNCENPLLDLSPQPPGIYFVQLSSNSKTTTLKIILSK